MASISKTGESSLSRGMHRSIRIDKAIPYLFIAPYYVVFITFFLGPALFAVYTSFHSWHLLGEMKFIGLKNFEVLLKDLSFRLAVRNTLFYITSAIFLQWPLSLVLAVIINQRFLRGARIFSTVYFIPILTSSVVVSIVFIMFLDKSYGLFNAPFIALGMKPINWLGTREMSKFAVLLLIMWRYVGYNMIFFLATLQAIPRELYEAAWVDGASRLDTFWHITLPLLRPAIAYVMILGIIGGWQLFDEPFLLTKGGPADSSMSVANYLYRVSITNMRMGYGSAIGLVLFVVVFMITLVQLRYFGVIGKEESNA
jgi:multiple sugar transport system permease protein